MGKSFGKKKFVIADDGTIIRGDNKGGKKGWIILVIIVVSIVTIGLTMYMTSSEWDNSVSYYEPVEWCGTVGEECVEEPVCEPVADGYVSEGYVDLGLPSGTLWRNWNEKGDFYYSEAHSTFGSQLPTRRQWEELRRYCKWTWGSNGEYCGYWVKGRNNYAIFLPAACTNDDGGDVNIDDLENVGRYISSDVDSDDSATWILFFDEENIDGGYDYIEYCGWGSVRLVYEN